MIEGFVVAASEGERQTFDWGEIIWMDEAGLTDSNALTVGKVTVRAGGGEPGASPPEL